MRRYKRSLWANTFLSFAAAVIWGIMCGGAAEVAFSALSCYIFRNMQFVKIFAVISLIIAGTFSGRLYGRYRRRRGLIDGCICGMIIYTAISAAGLALYGSPSDIKKLLLLVIAGAAGGISGVNTKRPRSLTDNA